jgi:hypothetical protein
VYCGREKKEMAGVGQAARRRRPRPGE